MLPGGSISGIHPAGEAEEEVLMHRGSLPSASLLANAIPLRRLQTEKMHAYPMQSISLIANAQSSINLQQELISLFTNVHYQLLDAIDMKNQSH